MKTYELWMHREAGECYAVRLEDGQVTGATGPLAAAALTRRREIAATDYDDVVVTARLETQRPLFTVVDQWEDDLSGCLDLTAFSSIEAGRDEG
jgi:hypothetical protein